MLVVRELFSDGIVAGVTLGYSAKLWSMYISSFTVSAALVALWFRYARSSDSFIPGYGSESTLWLESLLKSLAAGLNRGGSRLTSLAVVHYSFVVFVVIAAQNVFSLLGCGMGMSVNYAFLSTMAWIPWIAVMAVLAAHLRLASLGQFVHRRVHPAVAPLLVLLETITFFTRLVSLVVRLFANACAGHILVTLWLFLLTSWMAAVTGSTGALAVATGAFSGVALFIVVLEAGVSVLQAYIFTLLVSDFMRDRALVV